MATKKTATSKYWERRFTAMDDAMYKNTDAYIKGLEKRFERATRQMSKDLSYWYGRLAENNEISYTAAKQLLAKDELEDFHMTLEEYIKHAEELDLNPAWQKKLVNASAKVHISRLEEMQLELRNTIENLFHDYEGSVTKYLSELVPNSYYHTAYELARGTGVATTLHKLDNGAISDFLTKPWAKDGKAFSGRIWARRDDLVRSVNNHLAQLLITGKDPQKAINEIAHEFGVEKSAAGRLVMTETAALNTEARRQCMKDLDVEEYEIVATLDSRTSNICRSMDGQHFPLGSFEIGLNAPPFHCNCRSCTVPYFDDEFTQDETRAARGLGDTGYERTSKKQYFDWARGLKKEYGQIYKMDPNWEYKKWYKEVVEKKCRGMLPMNLQFFAPKNEVPSPIIFNKGCKNVTKQWEANSKPGQGKIENADVYIHNGLPYYEDGVNVKLMTSPREEQVGEMLVKKYGGDLQYVPEVKGVYKNVSTPDYIWRGERWDLKELKETTNNEALRNIIHKKSAQAENFIFDITDSKLSYEQVKEQALKCFDYENTAKMKRIMIIKRDEVLDILERK